MNKPDYCEFKAIELINEAQAVLKSCELTDIENYEDKISEAISLLALARAQRNNGNGPS